MNKNKAEELDLEQEAPQEQMALDDTRRVKVLSPGMLVFKRFIRNKLAVAGIVILVVMFLFSFLGPLFSPYGLEDRFFKYKPEELSYATAKTKDVWFTGDIDDEIRTGALREIGKTMFMGTYQLKADQEFNFFNEDGEQFTVRVISPDPYTPSTAVYGSTEIASFRRGEMQYYDPAIVDDELLNIIRNHVESKSSETQFEYNGMQVFVQLTMVERRYFVASDTPLAVSSFNRYTPINGKVFELESDPQFMHEASVAALAGESSFEYEGNVYTLSVEDDDTQVLQSSGGDMLFRLVRDYRYGKVDPSGENKTSSELVSFVSTISSEGAFREALQQAMNAGEHSFSFENETYSIEENETQILLTSSDNVQVLSIANRFDVAPSQYDNYYQDVEFVLALEKAIASRDTIFMFENERFSWSSEGDDYIVYNPQHIRNRSHSPASSHYPMRSHHHFLRCWGRYQ